MSDCRPENAGTEHAGTETAGTNEGRATSLRPFTILSCCMSLDGYLDDGTEERMLLSNAADFDRVDELRSRSDALLVGAATVRNDDPRLLVRSDQRISRRLAEGRSAHPTKVTVTRSAELDPTARFFTHGDAAKLVYCHDDNAAQAAEQLGAAATVVRAGRPVTFSSVCVDLYGRGVRRLLVEGGGSVHTQFLTGGLADELHLAIAPVFVGSPRATRFVGPGQFPFAGAERATLVETRAIGDVVMLRYLLNRPGR